MERRIISLRELNLKDGDVVALADLEVHPPLEVRSQNSWEIGVFQRYGLNEKKEPICAAYYDAPLHLFFPSQNRSPVFMPDIRIFSEGLRVGQRSVNDSENLFEVKVSAVHVGKENIIHALEEDPHYRFYSSLFRQFWNIPKK
jgi:hypothetical protein